MIFKFPIKTQFTGALLGDIKELFKSETWPFQNEVCYTCDSGFSFIMNITAQYFLWMPVGCGYVELEEGNSPVIVLRTSVWTRTMLMILILLGICASICCVISFYGSSFRPFIEFIAVSAVFLGLWFSFYLLAVISVRSFIFVALTELEEGEGK